MSSNLVVGISRDGGRTWQPVYTDVPQKPQPLAGLIVPFYIYPGPAWDALISVKKKYPAVSIIAIANPDNGVGTSADSTYAKYISLLQAAGIRVIGYVYTSYGARLLSDVQVEITEWFNRYSVDGIFLDEMSSADAKQAYYAFLSQYASSKANKWLTVVGNPGTIVSNSLAKSVDICMTYEGSPKDAAQFPPNVPRDQLAAVQYACPSLDSSWIKATAQKAAWLYQTGDVLENPYDTLPTYLDSEMALLAS